MSFVDTFDCLIGIVSDRDVSPDRYRITAADQPDAIIVQVMLLYRRLIIADTLVCCWTATAETAGLTPAGLINPPERKTRYILNNRRFVRELHSRHKHIPVLKEHCTPACLSKYITDVFIRRDEHQLDQLRLHPLDHLLVSNLDVARAPHVEWVGRNRGGGFIVTPNGHGTVPVTF